MSTIRQRVRWQRVRHKLNGVNQLKNMSQPQTPIEGDVQMTSDSPVASPVTAPATPIESKEPIELKEKPQQTASDSQLAAKLKQAEEALEEERAYHNQAKSDLEKKQKEVDDIRKKWRDAAGELNRFLRQNQGFNQLTDQELVQKATQLRFEIRNFTIQFFEDQISDPKIDAELLEFLNQYLRLPEEKYKSYLQTPDMRSSAVRAFIWAFLKKEIFGQFRWAPTKASDCVFYMSDFINKSLGTDAANSDDSDALRKYHMWRSNTSSLLQEATKNDPKTAASTAKKLCANHAADIIKFLGRLSSSKPAVIQDQLARILQQSLDIDKDISKQVASVTWKFMRKDSSLKFDPEKMDLEPGKKLTGDEKTVALVLAPGLVKRGRSSGDEYNVQYRLMKKEVACAPK